MKSVEEEEHKKDLLGKKKRWQKKKKKERSLGGIITNPQNTLGATATTKDQQSDDDVHASRRSCRGQPIFLHLPSTTSHQRRVANQGRFFSRLLAKKTNVRNSR